MTYTTAGRMVLFVDEGDLELVTGSNGPVGAAAVPRRLVAAGKPLRGNIPFTVGYGCHCLGDGGAGPGSASPQLHDHLRFVLATGAEIQPTRRTR
jgi:hypothetical protein